MKFITNRVGETVITHQGFIATIIKYDTVRRVTAYNNYVEQQYYNFAIQYKNIIPKQLYDYLINFKNNP